MTNKFRYEDLIDKNYEKNAIKDKMWINKMQYVRSHCEDLRVFKVYTKLHIFNDCIWYFNFFMTGMIVMGLFDLLIK